jgi:hypothetical protein
MSSLKHKMTNYEVVPPAQAWDNIAASLDESESGQSFPSRLHDMQVNPPAAAWINIENELTGAEAPVIPLKKRSNPFVRYAAAAIVIGILAVAVFRYSGRTNGTSDVNPTKDIATTQPEKSGVIPAPPTEKNNLPAINPDEVIIDNRAVIAQVEQPSHTAEHRSIHRASAVSNYPSGDASDYAGNPLYAYADYTLPDVADRYIMLMTPQGTIIRMSKKLGNLVCCVSGEEQDADCKSQLKKWQEKLASSPAAPGNFLDIVNMVNSLDDNGTVL